MTAVAVAAVVGIVKTVLRATSGRVMTRMMEDVMPRMMDRCFGQMPPEQRASMIARCRRELDRVEAKYVGGAAAITEPTPGDAAQEPAAAGAVNG